MVGLAHNIQLLTLNGGPSPPHKSKRRFQMRSILIALIAVALVVGYMATPAVAHWVPADGCKMHFPQLPDSIGWDVNATWPVVLADDWQCSCTGPVEDIHFWGSWKGGIVGTITAFRISIHANVPGPPSTPGSLLWEREITTFVTTPPIDPPGKQGWYNPVSGTYITNDHDPYFQYNITNIPTPFEQHKGTIYWLNISAVVADTVNTRWGWKSSKNHFMDDAVWSPNGLAPWTPMREPPAFTQTLDLAFVITGPNTVCTPTLTQWGLIGLMLLFLAIATWVFFWRRKALRGKVA